VTELAFNGSYDKLSLCVYGCPVGLSGTAVDVVSSLLSDNARWIPTRELEALSLPRAWSADDDESVEDAGEDLLTLSRAQHAASTSPSPTRPDGDPEQLVELKELLATSPIVRADASGKGRDDDFPALTQILYLAVGSAHAALQLCIGDDGELQHWDETVLREAVSLAKGVCMAGKLSVNDFMVRTLSVFPVPEMVPS
jgi:hypothetical protein